MIVHPYDQLIAENYILTGLVFVLIVTNILQMIRWYLFTREEVMKDSLCAKTLQDIKWYGSIPYVHGFAENGEECDECKKRKGGSDET